MNHKNKYLLIIAIIVLIIFNILSLVKNIIGANDYKLLLDKNNSLAEIFNINTFENYSQLHGKVNLSQENIDKIKLLDKAKRNICILLFFQNKDCEICLKQEISSLNELTKKNISVLSFIYKEFGNNIDYIRKTNQIHFPIYSTDSNDFILYNLSVKDTRYTSVDYKKSPVVIVLDTSTNIILDTYFPLPNNLLRRDSFYNKWRNILKIIKD